MSEPLCSQTSRPKGVQTSESAIGRADVKHGDLEIEKSYSKGETADSKAKTADFRALDANFKGRTPNCEAGAVNSKAGAAVALERACELCGSLEGRELSMTGRGGASFRTVICPSCGLVFSDPFPHDVRDFYEKSYRLDYKGAYIPKLKHVLRAGLVALNRHLRLGEYFPKGARLLDIGSGGGEFVYLMTRLGLAAKGVEPNLGYAEYSRGALGLDVTVAFIQDVDFPPAFFDVMTVWHVLEHTEAPAQVLRRLGAMLAAGGRLIVEVPNVKAVCQSPAGAFHVAHLYNFSVATLSAMMRQAGLTPERSFLSPDGGNLTVIARRSADSGGTTASGSAASGEPVGALKAGLGHDGASEAREVQSLISGRSALGYALSSWPARRAWGRLRRAVSERWRLRGVKDGPDARRAILDQLYRDVAGPAGAINHGGRD